MKAQAGNSAMTSAHLPAFSTSQLHHLINIHEVS